ncbi:PRC-barrel domain-containing protein [Ruegeria arenilitoris]|uniref:PRC-barrel domain-containing protein n=1 Tax=Ruegeria arenilitoris TaxID=1173585 RepID=UPI00147CC873|nr:PRC-barrel domain-containing protein [Ruegeria arenilitoris]
MKLSDLINTPVVPAGADQAIGRVSDIAIRAGQTELEYVLVNLSLTGGNDPVAFSADTLELGASEVTCAISQQQVDHLRQRKDDEDPLAVDIEGLPPLVVGPFGNAIAPVVMGAVLNDALRKRPQPTPPGSNFRWFTKLQGNPVFDVTGELGRFKDIEFDPDTKTLRFLLIDARPGILSFPFAELRNIPDDEHYMVQSRSSDPLHPV